MNRIYNVPDKLNNKGLWVQKYKIGDTTYDTRSGILWNNMKMRVNKASTLKNRCYQDTKILFEGFQEFAGWCQGEYGHMLVDSKMRFWCLDKDISSGTNYGPETCIFVPASVNNLFVDLTTANGYSYHKGSGMFQVRCCGEYIGMYQSELEAASIYKKAKLIVLKELNTDEIVKDHTKFQSFLLKIIREWEKEEE